MTPAQFYFGLSVPCLLILVGILMNNQRINDLRAEMIGRIDSLRDSLRAEMKQLGSELHAEMAKNHAETVAKIAELEARSPLIRT
jgi:hypothetical protein